ncbi:protein of unknown function DUF2786 [Rhizobium phage RHph_X2_30]|nr:protein of unknown function DUF2786 [Rhizobium phage RHph_X2_30]
MSENRDKIAGRIRALLAKTVENGCTEDEAISAARMAAALLAKYNMTIDETELRSNPFKRDSFQREDEIGERLWKVASAISELTGSRYWRSRHGVVPVEITFFGFAHEVDVSKYLLAICVRALNDGKKQILREHALLVPARRRRHMIAFIDGMVDRLAERILDLKEPVPPGTGLVVVRNSLIDEALAKDNIKLENMRGRKSRDFDEAYIQGLLKGDEVSLNRGVSDRGGERLQLKRR